MTINCGHCSASHATVAEVRACATTQQPSLPLAPAFTPPARPTQPATQKQLNYAHSLLRSRQPYGEVADAERTNSLEAAHELVSGMDRMTIRDFISGMLERPDRQDKARPAAGRVGEGMYRMQGDVFKVQVAVHGSGHLYAKQLIHTRQPDGTTKGTFVRAPGALSRLRPRHKMSLDDAKIYGRLYGFCIRCCATLTDEDSIGRGIGPVCLDRW